MSASGRPAVREPRELKSSVKSYWEKKSCGTEAAKSTKYSRAYFEEIENHRYRVEPEIFSFAQFTRARGQRVLEVGVGAGTDFLQWTRAGADAVGIDLTSEAVENVRHRLEVYGLDAKVFQADCENLPFEDGTFDLVYSWGVIHHTPDTWRAFDETIRVCKPGGWCKIMIYNRHSANAIRHWIDRCLLRGEPWHSLSYALWHGLESEGTKGFTPAEVRAHLAKKPIKDLSVTSRPTFYDEPRPEHSARLKLKMRLAHAAARALRWDKEGWFLLVEFRKA